ncbi:MAG: metal ABC transporter permease [Rhodobacteraceae bacterium]|nr:metal ABC transporter permease [Paracoccaceae bacterium]
MARIPETMTIGAILIGAASALGGLWATLMLDTPTGPTIVCVAELIFPLSALVAGIRNR